MDSLQSALMAWREILGIENIITDATTIRTSQTATFATNQKISAIIRPSNRNEVQKCVQVACIYKTPIYPISCGKNWGYGSRVPVRDGCVVMDLGRLNSILDYDEKLGYVTVEPGVTMRQMYEFLRERESPLMLSLTGSTMDSSIVGNVLERGFGTGLYADRFGHVCAFEVILPTGECIHSGFERFPNAKTAKVSRCGVGPYIDGIFTQSNLGIVTRMTVWLMLIPTYRQTCFFAIQQNESFAELVDTLQTLKFQGVCTSPIHLFNDRKILSLVAQYPWKIAGGHPFLSSYFMADMRKAMGIGVWNGAVDIHAASEKHGHVLRELIQQSLSDKVDMLGFVDNSRVQFSYGEDEKQILLLQQLKDALDNPANDGNIRSTYWRKKTPIPKKMDPDRDRCGVIWCSPSVPFDGKHVRKTVGIIEQTCAAHQFEPNVSMMCLTERNVVINAALIYDRDVAGEDEHALACYEEMLQKLSEEGYLPYRLGIQSMDALPTAQDDYGKFFLTLKAALDPNDILAPGRYDFRMDWPDGSRNIFDERTKLRLQ